MSRYVVHAGPACGIQCEHGDGVPPRCPAELTWQLQTMDTCRAHVARDGDPRLPSRRQDGRSHGLEPQPLWMVTVRSGQVSFETSCSRPHVGHHTPRSASGRASRRPCRSAAWHACAGRYHRVSICATDAVRGWSSPDGTHALWMPQCHSPPLSLSCVRPNENHSSTSISHEHHTYPDSCGVQTHALADWRLKPAP